MSTETLQHGRQRFARQLLGLSKDELLNRQIEFEKRPAALEAERAERLEEATCLEAALAHAFGPGGWQRPLEERRKSLMTLNG